MSFLIVPCESWVNTLPRLGSTICKCASTQTEFDQTCSANSLCHHEKSAFFKLHRIRYTSFLHLLGSTADGEIKKLRAEHIRCSHWLRVLVAVGDQSPMLDHTHWL